MPHAALYQSSAIQRAILIFEADDLAVCAKAGRQARRVKAEEGKKGMGFRAAGCGMRHQDSSKAKRFIAQLGPNHLLTIGRAVALAE